MKKAIRLLTRFIDEKLNGNIEKLTTFNLENLRNEEYRDFSCKVKRFEYDNTELTKAIFVVLWHDTFKDTDMELTMDTVGDGKAFRGDTIHTTGALCGYDWEALKNFRTNADDTGKKWAEDSHHISKACFTEAELKDLLDTCQIARIGNMLLLPSTSLKHISAKGNTCFVTINTYRGFQSGWHDYFDTFLFHLQTCLPIANEAVPNNDDLSLINLVLQPGNKTYFQHFGTFEAWLQAMMLDDYLEPNSNHPKKIFKDLEVKEYPYYYRFRNISEQRLNTYRLQVLTFLEYTNELITRRSQRMVQALRKKLED